jgi:hypothetical protein
VSVPATVIVIPVEGRAFAYLVGCEHFEDEVRLAFDRANRDVVVDVLKALIAMCETIADAIEAA